MFKLSTAAVTLAAACQVLAHGGVLSYSWGGQWYWGFKPYNTPTGQVTIQREWDTYNPIQDATDPTIACNDAGTALPSGQQLTGTAAAGTAITAYWNNPWPHPYGPMLTYMANCNGNCDNANAATLDWFKIDQSGLLSGTVGSGTWGSGEMIANNNSWTSTIPSCIPAGNYLIRFETIALHSQPAQWYPECAQLTVTGGGSTVPANTCKLPGCYSNTDPGTDIDIYGQAAQTQTTYVIPGPALFTCGGGGNTKTTTTTTKTSSTSSGKTTTTTTSSTKTSSTSKTTTTTTTTTSSNGATQTQYGQCGGASYTGPTVCVSPYKCTYSNTYYSQCL